MRYVSHMRGNDTQGKTCSFIDIEEWIPARHPLRRIRKLADEALAGLDGHFASLYSNLGRPSIPPEQLLRALLLQVLYGVRSERQLMERIKYDLLFRWFVGLGIHEEEWDGTVFTKNRDRLMKGEISQRMLEAVVVRARGEGLLSEEHFTVDGTILEAWASRASFHPKDPTGVVGTGTGGRKCLRDTHESATDAEARLYKKSTAGEAKPSYLGHVLMENRNGFVVAACATQSSKTAEAEAALSMLDELGKSPTRGQPAGQMTLGADSAYQREDFIEGLRKRHVAPHVIEYVENDKFKNFLTPAEREDPRFGISKSKRKLVEKVFGWGKLDSLMRKMKLQGQKRVDWFFRLLVTANNLVRLAKLIPA